MNERLKKLGRLLVLMRGPLALLGSLCVLALVIVAISRSKSSEKREINKPVSTSKSGFAFAQQSTKTTNVSASDIVTDLDVQAPQTTLPGTPITVAFHTTQPTNAPIQSATAAADITSKSPSSIGVKKKEGPKLDTGEGTTPGLHFELPAMPTLEPMAFPAHAPLPPLPTLLGTTPENNIRLGGNFPNNPLEFPPIKEEDQPALKRPLESSEPPTLRPVEVTWPGGYQAPFDAPLGFTGPSGILPRESQTDPHFVPVEDRWRIGFPDWKRYTEPTTPDADAPYQRGHWWDPYNQNVLKGDYPFLGQNIFFVLTAQSRTVVEPRQTPIATTPFESTARPFEADFFGRPNQALVSQFFSLGLEVFQGDAAFRPVDWRIRATPVFNINYVDFQELAVVNPDVLQGSDRTRSYFALQEWFVEKKLADLSPNYDFVSVRAGAQPFVSDFRGFIFSDTNRAVRLFGNLDSNREQFNFIYFRQLEKDTNSELNTFRDRHQQVLIANYFVQDFFFPGYTAQWSIHYNHDDPSFKFDNNSFLVRPDPVGTFTPHGLDVMYLGWTGDGHINRFNITHAGYWAFGRDSNNPIANQGQDISAGMAALELSYDRDYVRFRASALWASGDDNPRNGHATGFDAIFDNPNFAGGEFSYWQRQAIRLFGVNLVNRESLFPDLKSSKIQGQSNFVNPGLFLFNAGVDVDVTPKLRWINNVNFLWFDSVEVLRTFTFQQRIDDFIGIDLSTGIEYRPLLSNNVILTAGVSSLVPGDGFRSLFNDSRNSADFMVAGFLDLVLRY